MSARQRTVLVVDDDPSTFKAIARMARERHFTVLPFPRRADLLAWARQAHSYPPAVAPIYCVVFDARFVDAFEPEPVRQRLGTQPRICISRSTRLSAALNSIKLGLFDFIEKPFRLAQMADTIDRAFDHHEALIDPSTGPDAFLDRFGRLTKREAEICILLARGGTAKAISYQLGIAVKTFYVHRTNLMKKMGVKSVHELAERYRQVAVEPALQFPNLAVAQATKPESP